MLPSESRKRSCEKFRFLCAIAPATNIESNPAVRNGKRLAMSMRLMRRLRDSHLSHCAVAFYSLYLFIVFSLYYFIFNVFDF